MQFTHKENVLNEHQPVMLDKILQILEPKSDKLYFDGTFGGGSVSEAILNTSLCKVYACDKDPQAELIARAKANAFARRFFFIKNCFSDIDISLEKFGLETENSIDGIIFDLGLSTNQLNNYARGFSFMNDGPLDMRFDTNQGKTAASVLSIISEKELKQILYNYGEEKNASRIAKAIIKARQLKSITTTKALREIIEKTGIQKPKKIHVATKSFQALRIYVNDELSILSIALKKSVKALKPGGKLVVISFHSLEDRIVKLFFNSLAKVKANPSRYAPQTTSGINSSPNYKLIVKKPLSATAEEISLNPRSRSAKLRAIEKLNLQSTNSVSLN